MADWAAYDSEVRQLAGTIMRRVNPDFPEGKRQRVALETADRILNQQRAQARLFRFRSQCQPPPRQSPQLWPPVWRVLDQSLQFGLLQPYLQIEDTMKFDMHCDGDGRLNNPHNHNILRFLEQVRESRGFDLDNCPQEFLKGGFPLMPAPPLLLECDELYKQDCQRKISLVVAEINEQAQRHGERYEFGGGAWKRVDALSHRLTLLTVTVNQVAPRGQVKVIQAMVFGCGRRYQIVDWRFKPQDYASASST